MYLSKTKKILLRATAIIFLAIIIMLFLPLAYVSAAELTIGNINYVGSSHYCYYDLKISDDYISGTTIGGSGNFSIYMLGIKCKRSVFNSINYDITFILTHNDVQLQSKKIVFKINDQDDVPTDRHNIFTNTDLQGTGVYGIHWSGTIKAFSTEQINGSSNFTIA